MASQVTLNELIAEGDILPRPHHDVYPFIDPKNNLRDAGKGKSVLITGAGTGIGKAIAKAFAQTGAKNIVITGRRQQVLDQAKEEISKLSKTVNVLAISADVVDEASIEALFKQVQNADIELDVLINNAAANYDWGSIARSDVNLWWKSFEINFKGPYVLTKFFFNHLEARGSTSDNVIINVSSLAANISAPTQSQYAPAKVALNRFTEFAALEGRRLGVQAISYHPGGIAGTELSSQIPDWMKVFQQDTLELAAGVALYLSTPRAAYLNGRFVDACWDLEELEKLKDRIVAEDLLKTGVIGMKRVQLPDAFLQLHDKE